MSLNASCCKEPLWAREGLRRVAGDTLRPGGTALTDRALVLAGIPPGAAILDAGCGLGASVAHLGALGYRAVGLDVSPGQILRGGRKGLGLVAADVAAPPFAAGRFDAVLCECVLSLMRRPDMALAALSRVLVHGGVMMISDLWVRRRGLRMDAPGECAAGAFTTGELERMLACCGLIPEVMEDHSRLLAELAARLILAGELDRKRCGTSGLGYFLLVARKHEG